MKAMILAAGRGERMRPLTNVLPKPLLLAGGKPLIVYHIEKLALLGIKEVIINIAYLGDKIKAALGDGSQWGISIQYSEEPEPLETGGALYQALPLLGEAPFLLVNGDVWTDTDFKQLIQPLDNECLGRLMLVSNPEHNSSGDFALSEDSLLKRVDGSLENTYTFAGIACFHPDLIRQYPDVRSIFPLREVFHYYIEKQQLQGQYYDGVWLDIGTPERLHSLDQQLSVKAQ